ncbi:hypothetical protein [Lactococcus lactis]|uniref:hypothetical protein n=1 Tax=Lactococcus lactis TaxID=1358 RepID=UPI0028BD4E8C|nr:hypothetical protein [Lactococcus lactis]WNN69091.1 hypothetical protein RIN59_03225 [Lactococcus lactis]WPK08173.1 hypothetical protein R6U80_08135 [Lactococcus lactis]
MKKLFLLPIMATLLLLVTSCANNSSKPSNTDLTAEKYTEIIKNLKKELSSINDVSWNFKKSNDVTNADISKGTLIEVFPKNEKDSLSLMDTYIGLGSKDKEAKSKITELQKKVAKVARTLPNDNVEIELGFKSEQKSKGVIPVAKSIKSMDAIPINSSK